MVQTDTHVVIVINHSNIGNKNLDILKFVIIINTSY